MHTNELFATDFQNGLSIFRYPRCVSCAWPVKKVIAREEKQKDRTCSAEELFVGSHLRENPSMKVPIWFTSPLLPLPFCSLLSLHKI